VEASAEAPRRGIEPGRVISEAFSLYRDYFAPLILMALAIFVVTGLVQGLLADAGGWAAQLVSSAVNLAAVALYTGFVVKLVEDVRDGRRDFTAGELFSAGSAAAITLVLNGILRGIAVAIGLLLLIVPGLYLLTIWAVTSPAIVAERRGVIEAFGRSQELVRGEGWSVFLTILLAFLITAGVTIVALAIGSGLGVGGLIILGIIASTLTAPIGALVASVLFFDLGGSSSPAAQSRTQAPEPGI
jgi:hypothetical protein